MSGPIRLLEAHQHPPTVARFFRAADFCYVGSLHDGMNLVSKEFVGARDDERGVLMLSALAGAAHELTDALDRQPVRPRRGARRSIAAALTMPPAEQRERMRRMRAPSSARTARHGRAGFSRHVS